MHDRRGQSNYNTRLHVCRTMEAIRLGFNLAGSAFVTEFDGVKRYIVIGNDGELWSVAGELKPMPEETARLLRRGDDHA